MDEYLTISRPIGQRLEIYTELFVVQGLYTMAAARLSEMLNRVTTDFLTLHDATITPVGQTPKPGGGENPVLVKRSLVNFVADLPTEESARPVARPGTGSLAGREAYVQKATLPCYSITGPYAIYGFCYLHPGTSLENLLEGADAFIPVTRATIYSVNRPSASWQRESIILNKAMLTAMYLVPQQ